MTGQSALAPRDPDGHLFEQVMAASRPTPAGRGRDVGAWEAIIAKAVALSPRDRWKNAGALLAALDAVEGSGLSVVAAPPVSSPEPVATRSRARKLAWVGGAFALAAAGVLGIGARLRAPATPTPRPPVAAAPTEVSPPALPTPAAPPPPPAAAPNAATVAEPSASPARRSSARHRSKPNVTAPAAPVARPEPTKDPKPPPNDGSDLFDDTK
jgi:hypothetical protein